MQTSATKVVLSVVVAALGLGAGAFVVYRATHKADLSIQGIVFESNRRGSQGIYYRQLSDGRDFRIADTGLHESYPEVCPDEEYLLFERTHMQGPERASALVRKSLRTGEELVLPYAGQYPTCRHGTGTIVFVEDSARIVEVTLPNFERTVLFDRERDGFEGKLIAHARLSYDGTRLAFASDKRKRWTVWVFNRQTRESFPVGHGCEPYWRRDSRSLIFVERAYSAGERGIYLAAEPWSGGIERIHDAGAPRGYEYFPTLDSSEQFVYFGESTGESRVQPRFQLFAKNLPTGAIYRLTNDRFNNRWPRPLLKAPMLDVKPSEKTQ